MKKIDTINAAQISFDMAPAQKDDSSTFDQVRQRALSCRNCHLWEHATQTVFGEGPLTAPVMLIGEQPGDKEDFAGHPFVGPAGQKLNAALIDAGVDRRFLYVTNAVKHFKFTPRGRVRLHQKPVAAEIKACRPWLEEEISIVQPKLIVALGATAAQSLFRKAMPVGKNRSVMSDFGDSKALITIHPSYLLRIEDASQAVDEYNRFIADLALIKPYLAP